MVYLDNLSLFENLFAHSEFMSLSLGLGSCIFYIRKIANVCVSYKCRSANKCILQKKLYIYIYRYYILESTLKKIVTLFYVALCLPIILYIYILYYSDCPSISRSLLQSPTSFLGVVTLTNDSFQLDVQIFSLQGD